MTLPARVELVAVDRIVRSSYPIGGAWSELARIDAFGELARVPPDVASALIALHHAVELAGGQLRISDLRRDLEMQAEGRRKYERWLNAGKPSPSSPAFDSRNMKNAFVSRPGRSWHNAGRAIDVDVARLNFAGVDADRQLDELWSVAKAIGWRPIIRAPEERASEAWHFDFCGPWNPVRERLGYEAGAMCASLDIGIAAYGRDIARACQAQLHRAGYDVGDVDGYVGRMTRAGLLRAGAHDDPDLEALTYLFGLPGSPVAVWVAG